MKSLAVAAALFATARVCALDSNGPVNVTVVQETDLKQLAQGYAQAYTSLSRLVTLVMQRDGQQSTLTGVRSIKAQGAVLVVEVGRGALYLINPRDVVYISDDTANPSISPK